MRRADEAKRALLADCHRQYATPSAGGRWVRHGIVAAERALEAVPVEGEDEASWLEKAWLALREERRLAEDPDDEDGWQTGAVTTIVRVAEEALARLEDGTPRTIDTLQLEARTALDLSGMHWERAWMLEREVRLLLAAAEETTTAAAKGKCAVCRGPAARAVCEECWSACRTRYEPKAKMPERDMVVYEVARALRRRGTPRATATLAAIERAAARPARAPDCVLCGGASPEAPVCQRCLFAPR